MSKEEKNEVPNDLQERAKRASESPQFQTAMRKIEKVVKIWETFQKDMSPAINEVHAINQGGLAPAAFEQRIAEAGFWLNKLLEGAQQGVMMRIIAEQGKAADDEKKGTNPVPETIPFPETDDGRE